MVDDDDRDNGDKLVQCMISLNVVFTTVVMRRTRLKIRFTLTLKHATKIRFEFNRVPWACYIGKTWREVN
jgi:hypothetical protein